LGVRVEFDGTMAAVTKPGVPLDRAAG
jgi:hypothetical protein